MECHNHSCLLQSVFYLMARVEHLSKLQMGSNYATVKPFKGLPWYQDGRGDLTTVFKAAIAPALPLLPPPASVFHSLCSSAICAIVLLKSFALSYIPFGRECLPISAFLVYAGIVSLQDRFFWWPCLGLRTLSCMSSVHSCDCTLVLMICCLY